MSKVKIIPLGGVRENGKNMYVVEVDEDLFIFDSGLMYPENGLLGIDIVIPDFSYLRENKDRIVGVFLTHGHADAIGALAYFVSEFDVPVFGSELTIALAKLNIESDPKASKFNDFHVVDDQTEIDFGKTTISFFKTTHSIPESLGIVLGTDEGQIVYTGDFKFDQAAVPAYQTDFGRLAEIGKNGVLALLSDSANAENPFPTVNESAIDEYINETFEYQKGRIIVACVASNILRVQQILNAANESHRKVILTGHDVEKIVKTAMNLNKLILPDENVIVPMSDISKYDDDQLIILETGKMGEPLKSLQRMALNQHSAINIHEGDLVFITTTTSKAMETNVAKTKDLIYRAGADVKAISDELNSSGHAGQNDLQLMINLMQPKYLVPIQGEYRLLAAHADLAHVLGMPYDHIFITGKGDVLSYSDGKMNLGSQVEAGNTMIDGIGVGDIGNIVLRDRKILSEDGIFIAVVTIDRKKKKIINKPKITSRGFVYTKTSLDLIEKSAEIVSETVQDNLNNKEFDWGHLKQDVREKMSHFLYEQTKRRPVILPVIMEINQYHRKPAQPKEVKTSDAKSSEK
ncbi:ribonuclease J [Dellaglioa sp. BT-FLS60]